MLHEVTWTPDGGERRLGQGNATTREEQQIMHSWLEGQYSLLKDAFKGNKLPFWFKLYLASHGGWAC